MRIDELTAFANLLNTPNLDEQTLGVINAELRNMIGEYRTAPEPAAEKKDNQFDKTVFNEWTIDPELDKLFKGVGIQI